MKQLLLLGLSFLITSCGTPEPASPAPTPQPIQVSYPAALQPWADKLSICASSNPQVALYFSQGPTPGNTFNEEVVLVLGNPDPSVASSHLYQVGWEQIIVAVNKDNVLSRLSTENLRSIYSGVTSTWENGSDQPIQVWVLPDGDPTRILFDQAVLPLQSLASEAMLAPDPQAMLEAIAGNINAIGYLPGSILASGDPTLTSEIKIIQVDTLLDEALHQPVIAVVRSEPKGLVRSLLVCLQNQAP
jgi:hypothetical protein